MVTWMKHTSLICLLTPKTVHDTLDISMISEAYFTNRDHLNQHWYESMDK